MGSLTFCIRSSSQFSFIHGDIYYGKIPMGLFHTAAILSRETEITLFYHPNLSPEFFTVRSRVVKESFSLSAQYGCHVTKANGFDNKNIQSVFFPKVLLTSFATFGYGSYKLLLFCLVDHPSSWMFHSVYQVLWRTNLCSLEICAVTKKNSLLLSPTCGRGLL